MKDLFLIKQDLKSFLPVKIGFVIDNAVAYNETMASTRMRCYDIINYLDKKFIMAELFRPFRKYKVVLFQKSFSDDSVKLAQYLKKQGIKIIFDINVNYVQKEGEAREFIQDKQTENVLRMINLSDEVLVASLKLKEIYSRYHPAVTLIEEGVHDSFFKVMKTHYNKQYLNVMYCGYSAKAKELLLIADVLKELHKIYPLRLLFICETDPKLNIIPYEFLSYNQRILPKLLIKGDIKVAPRDLSNSYNWGHTFTKVAYPMAVGIPAVASPVPSYIGREVLICNDEDSWYKTLESLIKSLHYRSEMGTSARKFVKSHFSIEKIGFQYVKLFEKFL